MADIDFTAWTDAQLDAGLRYDAAGLMQAELDRRKAEGIEPDGSAERVAALVKPLRRRTRKV